MRRLDEWVFPIHTNPGRIRVYVVLASHLSREITSTNDGDVSFLHNTHSTYRQIGVSFYPRGGQRRYLVLLLKKASRGEGCFDPNYSIYAITLWRYTFTAILLILLHFKLDLRFASWCSVVANKDGRVNVLCWFPSDRGARKVDNVMLFKGVVYREYVYQSQYKNILLNNNSRYVESNDSMFM